MFIGGVDLQFEQFLICNSAKITQLHFLIFESELVKLEITCTVVHSPNSALKIYCYY